MCCSLATSRWDCLPTVDHSRWECSISRYRCERRAVSATMLLIQVFSTSRLKKHEIGPESRIKRPRRTVIHKSRNARQSNKIATRKCSNDAVRTTLNLELTPAVLALDLQQLTRRTVCTVTATKSHVATTAVRGMTIRKTPDLNGRRGPRAQRHALCIWKRYCSLYTIQPCRCKKMR